MRKFPPHHQNPESLYWLLHILIFFINLLTEIYIFFYRSCFWQISEVRKAGDGFFNLPIDVKKSYSRPSDGRNFGWVSLERERYDSWPKIFYNCVQTFHFYLHPQKTTGIQIFKFLQHPLKNEIWRVNFFVSTFEKSVRRVQILSLLWR